jgi:hypothetical protein
MRQLQELESRIADAAMHATGDVPLDIALLLRDIRDPRSTELGLQALDAIIDGRWSAPTDRFVFPPHNRLEPLSEPEACEQLIAALGDLDDAAPGTRALAYYWTAISTLNSDFAELAELAEPIVDRLATLAEEYRSPLTQQRVANSRASLAERRGDWHEMAHWSEVALAGPMRSGFTGTAYLAVSAGFKRLRAQAAAGRPITGRHLREPWEVLVSEGVEIQQWVGAMSTATATAALGRRELACRFLSFVSSEESRPDDFLVEPSRLAFAAVGLDWERDSAGPCTDSLDDLLAEVFALADSLDRRPA